MSEHRVIAGLRAEPLLNWSLCSDEPCQADDGSPCVKDVGFYAATGGEYDGQTLLIVSVHGSSPVAIPIDEVLAVKTAGHLLFPYLNRATGPTDIDIAYGALGAAVRRMPPPG